MTGKRKLKRQRSRKQLTPIEQDEFLAFQLRARLADMPFYMVWRFMSSLGWKFKNGKHYITPTGWNLGRAKEAMELLDTFSIAFQENGGNGDGDGDGDGNGGDNGRSMTSRPQLDLHLNQKVIGDVDLQKVRRDLLRAIFFESTGDSDSNGDGDTTSSDDSEDLTNDNDESDDDDDNNTPKKRKTHKEAANISEPLLPSRRSLRVSRVSASTSASTSATTNEPGTDQYFGSKPKKAKRNNKTRGKKSQKAKRQEGTTSTTTINHYTRDERQHSDVIIQCSKLSWPEPKECAANMMSSRNDVERSTRIAQDYINEHESMWKSLLSSNHSLLFHGFGSKRTMLNTFAKDSLRANGHVLTLNGFESNISMDRILDIMVQQFLNGVEPPLWNNNAIHNVDDDAECEYTSNLGFMPLAHMESTIVKRAIGISKAISTCRSKPIYLLVHNIDGIALRNRIAQDALSALVSNSIPTRVKGAKGQGQGQVQGNRMIGLVASTDHVDAQMLLWKTETLANFSWTWIMCNSHAPYDEIKHVVMSERKSVKTKKKLQVQFGSMIKVLQSLAPRHTRALMIQAKLQLSATSSDVNNLVPYDEWKDRCYQEMVVTKEGELQAIMRELIDHGIIEVKMTPGSRFMHIPLTRSQLKDILRKK